VTFQPSEHSYGDYGWSSSWPMSKLTVSSTGDRLGLSNQPTSSAHKANLSLLSDFLGKLPFGGTVTSAYRSPSVNEAVGGSSSSQHPNGLGVDFVPSGMTNEELATWLYENRANFPELDQVIWYTDTSHVHIGICPSGSTNCPRSQPRGQFLKAKKEGSIYTPWAPTATARAAMTAQYAYQSPVKTMAVMWASMFLTGGAVVLGLAVVYKLKKRRKKRKG
jgi:hypothetical protein